MTGFILVVAGLVLVLYLLQRRKPARNRDHFSSADYGYSGAASSETTNAYGGAGGEFGSAGASGSWGSSEPSGGDGGSDGGGGGGD